MRRLLLSIFLIHYSLSICVAQHVFQGTSLSKALIELDQSTTNYDISFVYDELEDFTVTAATSSWSASRKTAQN